MFQLALEARLFTFRYRDPHFTPLLQLPPQSATSAKRDFTPSYIYEESIEGLKLFCPNLKCCSLDEGKGGAEVPVGPGGEAEHGQAPRPAPHPGGAAAATERDENTVSCRINPEIVAYVC